MSSSVPSGPPPEFLTIITGQNVQCVQNVPFSLTLQAQGASSAITWKIMSGQLPSGLALDSSSGIISGTPLANSNSPVTIQAADAKASASSQFFFTVWGKLIINLINPAPAHLGAPFSLSISASGSSAVAQWSISAGQLPPGLSFALSPSNANFVSVSGTPSQVGTFTFTVQAQDYTLPQIATLGVSIVVDSHLALSKSSLKNGGQSQTYSDSFSVANGTPPFHWSVTGFPAGLGLDSASGAVTGTPTDFGSFPYSVSVTDSSSPVQSDSAQGFLSIAQQLHVVGTIPNAFIGMSYNQSLVALGGTYPYTWTLASGTLPPGLSLAQSGFITGTPTLLGAYNFVLQVTDSGSPPYVVTIPVAFQVTPQPLAEFGPPLSPAPVNVIYHSQIPASGGTPPYVWSVAFGQLPPGLSLDSSTGYIDGTPTQVGTFNFGARLTDSANPPQVTTPNDFIQIRPALGRNDSIATATPLGNSSSSILPIYTISPYIDPINAATPNPDTDFYRLVAVGGSLIHLETFARRSWGANTLDSVIEILDGSGKRLQSCIQPSYISVCLNDDVDASTTDSALDLKVPGPSTAQTTFYLHVLDWRGDARPDMQYFLNVSGVIDPLTISPTTLGLGATRGANYQQQFSANGGTGSVTWSLGGGSFPPGWSLSSSGLLSGVAATDGFYTFAIKATDAANPPQAANNQYTLQIAEPVTITSPATFPNACLNKPYLFTIQTAGGIPPIQFGFISNLWVAINLNQTTGTFSGVGGVLGTYTGSLGAIDAAQPPSNIGQTVTLTVVSCP